MDSFTRHYPAAVRLKGNDNSVPVAQLQLFAFIKQEVFTFSAACGMPAPDLV